MSKAGDIEDGENRGIDEMNAPLLKQGKTVASGQDDKLDGSDNGGSLGMVLLSTFVAVCGSFEFGSCVSNILSTATPFFFLFSERGNWNQV